MKPEYMAVMGQEKTRLQSGNSIIHALEENISVIRFEGVNVRIVKISGDPWFVAADVCKALEIQNTTNAIKPLDTDEQALCSIKGISRGNDLVNIVSESGFYKMMVRCRKSSTQGTLPYRFTNWVFRNVVPGIRKTGSYGVPWGALQDLTRRKGQYQISASKKGKALQACKVKKQALADEETRLLREHQPELILEEPRH
ncbi:Bro-N domain-containing protein [Yersinia pseudotuberculosis]|uniref:BRO-N domain-containing protein n=1 Tax=Yersinia pseudotuberculosis TaxID=633 RepID=UPI0004F86E33|nr:BRO family protein [Yersinia pseudotuberculosis]AIN15463.1 hypothetical protein DJ40_1320 [Yersinia pseudotuberculosis]